MFFVNFETIDFLMSFCYTLIERMCHMENTTDDIKKNIFPFNFWQQFALGLIFYGIFFRLNSIYDMAIYDWTGNVLYWGLFLINPVVPDGCPTITKKYVQITSLIFMMIPFLQYFLLR